MIKFYFGNEKYLIFHKFQEQKAKFKRENPNAHIGEFDFEQVTDLNQVREELVSGGGLFSSEKSIILKNVGSLNSLEQERLLEMLKISEVSEGDELIVFIVLLGKDKLQSKLKGFLTRKSKRNIESIEFKKKKEAEVKEWAISELEKRSDANVGIEKKG